MKFDIKDELATWLLGQSKRLTQQQSPDGYWEGGCNGPYKDHETPLRNTAHIIILFSSMGNYHNDQELLNAANKAVDYLLKKINLSEKQGIVFRQKIGKDVTNGVIGPAWIIEALMTAARHLNRTDASTMAEKIFLCHKFSQKYSCWYKMDTSEQLISKLDQTFNHQLWFASVASTLNLAETKNQVRKFIDNNLLKVSTYNDNVIYHGASLLGDAQIYKLIFNQRDLRLEIKRKLRKKSLRSKSVGYHSFNLYAISRLYQELSKPEEIRLLLNELLKPLQEKSFYRELAESKYSWDYNHPNIEYFFVYDTLNLLENYPDALRLNFIQSLEEYISKSCDVKTACARLYSISRIYLS